jgi:hypothetical protein
MVGMNPHKRNGALAQGRQQHPLPAAGRLQGDQAGINSLQPGADRLAGVGDALGFAPAAQIEPVLGNIDTDNRLVAHHRPPHNRRTAWSARRIAMRAKALPIVRVSDRDAGGSEVPTVAAPVQEAEGPPASPSRQWRPDYAIQEHRP